MAILAALAAAGWAAGQSRARAAAPEGRLAGLHSRPGHHGAYVALWTALAGFGVLLAGSLAAAAWTRSELQALAAAQAPDMAVMARDLAISDARAIAAGGTPSAVDPLRALLAERLAGLLRMPGMLVPGAAILAALGAMIWARGRVTAAFRARNATEAMVRLGLLAAALVAILTTFGIFAALIGETARFFTQVPIHKFLFGTVWAPLAGVFEGKLNPDQVGALPLFMGALLITAIALATAIPIGLFAAIYLSEYASPRMRALVKPVLEILAGVPTVVYGFFAAVTLAPALKALGAMLGLSVASESALAAGLTMGIMIIPFISSLSDDVINAVPQALRDGSLGLGATKAETIRKVVLRAALPGLASAVLLGFSRAIGETMIVVMAAGQGARLTFNPLEAATTVTVQIVMLITGDTEASTAAGPAFALGFTLFIVTLIFNVAAQRIVRKYREAYE